MTDAAGRDFQQNLPVFRNRDRDICQPEREGIRFQVFDRVEK
jgi:hypothetical protein